MQRDGPETPVKKQTSTRVGGEHKKTSSHNGKRKWSTARVGRRGKKKGQWGGTKGSREKNHWTGGGQQFLRKLNSKPQRRKGIEKIAEQDPR